MQYRRAQSHAQRGMRHGIVTATVMLPCLSATSWQRNRRFGLSIALVQAPGETGKLMMTHCDGVPRDVPKARQRSQRGFTLIELMIVVVIIGILAALAIPRFMTASVRAKQSEAKLILKQIYNEEHAYRQVYNRYFIPGGAADAANPHAFAPLCVEIMKAARYTFTITTADAGVATFTAQATVGGNGLDEDANPDTWTINELGQLVATSDDATI